MSILLVGSEGSMGKRYRAILRHLDRECVLVDRGHNPHYIDRTAKASDGIIIASPTNTHIEYLERFMALGKPILCEKPITKDIVRLEMFLDQARAAKTNLTMMYQYSLLAGTESGKWSYYDYFRHGNDGLIWDCLQIIALARGPIRLEEKSPHWTCLINGKALNSADMDGAYTDYVKRWLACPGQGLSEILDIHTKVSEFERKNKDASNQ